MPRAHRYYLPDLVWHIPHRCYNREFLLRDRRDRLNWIGWLAEARLRHGLSVLDYCVTCNHVHLLVWADNHRDVIPRSLQLVESATAQSHNVRVERSGAFWDDRYHATAVETHQHLMRCITYIDLNMVRAGVVSNPGEWREGGYCEFCGPDQARGILDCDRLAALTGARSVEHAVSLRRSAVEDARRAGSGRQKEWSEAVAVGSERFVEQIIEDLGYRGRRRTKIAMAGAGSGDGVLYALREDCRPYDPEVNEADTQRYVDNSLEWDVRI